MRLEVDGVTLDKPLPFEPEPLDAARVRYLASISRVWPPADDLPPDADVPAALRTHVFDFADGVRLTVQRVRGDNGVVAILVTGANVMRPMDIDTLVERYFDLAGKSYTGAIASGGLDGSGRIAWWTIREEN